MTLTDDERAILIKHGKAFLAASPYASKVEAIDEDALISAVENLASSDDGFVWLNEDGVFIGALVPAWFAPSVKMAVELAWFVARQGAGQKYRRKFEEWAKNKGATVQLSTLVDKRIKTVERMMTRAGYYPIEVSWRKDAA